MYAPEIEDEHNQKMLSAQVKKENEEIIDAPESMESSLSSDDEEKTIKLEKTYLMDLLSRYNQIKKRVI